MIKIIFKKILFILLFSALFLCPAQKAIAEETTDSSSQAPSLEQELAQVKSDLEDRKIMIQGVTLEKQKLLGKIAQLEKEKKAAEEEAFRLLAAPEFAEGQKSPEQRVKEVKATFEKEITKLQKRIESLQDSFKGRDERVRSFNQEKKRLEADIAAKSAEIHDLKASQSELSKRLKDSENKAVAQKKESDRKIADLGNNIKDLQDQLKKSKDAKPAQK